MTLQEETLRKGKSVHPTPQNTESHCRLQQPFLHIKMLSSGNLEAVKLGGRGGKGKKILGLVWFNFGLIFIVTNVSLSRLSVLEGAGAVCSGDTSALEDNTNKHSDSIPFSSDIPLPRPWQELLYQNWRSRVQAAGKGICLLSYRRGL